MKGGGRHDMGGGRHDSQKKLKDTTEDITEHAQCDYEYNVNNMRYSCVYHTWVKYTLVRMIME